MLIQNLLSEEIRYSVRHEVSEENDSVSFEMLLHFMMQGELIDGKGEEVQKSR